MELLQQRVAAQQAAVQQAAVQQAAQQAAQQRAAEVHAHLQQNSAAATLSQFAHLISQNQNAQAPVSAANENLQMIMAMMHQQQQQQNLLMQAQNNPAVVEAMRKFAEARTV